MKLVAQQLVIHAPADQLYELLVDPELFIQWMAGDAHHGGWTHYLDRLRTAAEGTAPGPDPFADRRVPTPEELTNP